MTSSAFVALKVILVSLVIVSLFNQNEGRRWWRKRRCGRVNCEMDPWTNWSPTCSSGCPGVTQHRHTHIHRHPSCGGSACPPSSSHEQTWSCNKCYNGGIGHDGNSYAINGVTCYCKNNYIDNCCKTSEHTSSKLV